MPTRLAEVADWLDRQYAGGQSVPDVLTRDPALSLDDAYRVQQILIERRVAAGDRVVGYKAAFTSAGMQAKFDLRVEPVVLRVNGDVRGSATAAEVLGGGIVPSVVVQPGDEIELDFTRLGRVRMRIGD